MTTVVDGSAHGPGPAPGDEPAWRTRALRRSMTAARVRAGQRATSILVAARELILETGGTGFTVQDVISRAEVSLRGFYQHFAGKDELVLALLEDAMREVAEQVLAATRDQGDPLEALRVAVAVLHASAAPDSAARHPFLIDVVHQSLKAYPTQVWPAHEPVLAAFTQLLARAAECGLLRSGLPARRAAETVVQVVMYLGESSVVGLDSEYSHPLTAEEIWEFCRGGFSR
jgi:AcrR family transcriptional regulator